MANTFNGIGTTFYGQAGFEQDDSFITTKWFVLAFFPLAPLASMRVRYLGTSGVPLLSRTSSFEVVEELPIDWLQVLRIWVYAVFITGLAINLLSGQRHVGFKFLLFVLGAALPFIVRFFSRKLATG